MVSWRLVEILSVVLINENKFDAVLVIIPEHKELDFLVLDSERCFLVVFLQLSCYVSFPW